jgi:hypothetical protein
MTLRTWPEQKAHEAGMTQAEAKAARREWLAAIVETYSGAKEASHVLSLDRSWLQKMTKQAGLKFRSARVMICPVRLRNLASQGLYAKDIAAALGVNRQSVYDACDRLGVEIARATAKRSKAGTRAPRKSRAKPQPVMRLPAPKPQPKTMSEFAALENRAARSSWGAGK